MIRLQRHKEAGARIGAGSPDDATTATPLPDTGVKPSPAEVADTEDLEAPIEAPKDFSSS